MYVCVCTGVTDHDIIHEVENGASTLADITMRTGAGTNCGSCIALTETILHNAQMKSAARGNNNQSQPPISLEHLQLPSNSRGFAFA